MSNEPTSKRLLAQPPSAPAGPATETRSDAERLLAAVERMDTAVRHEPDTHERLRAGLAAMAQALADAKLAIDEGRTPDNIGELLRDLAARTQQMLALVGAAPAEPQEPASFVEPAHGTEEQAFLQAMGVGEPVEAAAPAQDTQASTAPSDTAQADAAQTDAAAADVAEADIERVPTVSGVVSQLGRATDDSAEAAQAHPTSTEDEPTTVAMLEAMVEELAASMPATPPAPDEPPHAASEPPRAIAEPSVLPADQPQSIAEPSAPPSGQPEAVTEPPAPAEQPAAAAQPAPDEPPQAVFVAPPPETASPEAAPPEAVSSEPEAAAPAEPEPAPAEPEPPPAADEPAARGAVMPELELLSNFARMEEMTYLPPEIGTAVIFGEDDPDMDAPEEAYPDPTSPVVSELAEPVLVMPPPDPVETAAEEEDAYPDPTSPVAAELASPEPVLVMPPADPLDRTEEAARDMAEPQPPAETAAEAAANLAVLEPRPEGGAELDDRDLEALLFEPEGAAEPDPASFLLEPAPVREPATPPPAATHSIAPAASWDIDPLIPAVQRAPAAVIEQPRPAAEQPSPAAVIEQPPSAAVTEPRPAPGAAASIPHDPLAPLKTMSDEEKIALFE